MSKTRPVGFAGHGELWAYDAALSVLLAEVIRLGEAAPRPRWWDEQADELRIQATVSDLYFELSSPTAGELAVLFEHAASALEQRGSLTPAEAAAWKVYGDEPVIFRGEVPMDTAPIAELGLALVELIRGTLEDAPEGTWWYYGAPGGRRTIAMRLD